VRQGAGPIIKDMRDVIIKVTSCVICGSDLHLMDGQTHVKRYLEPLTKLIQEGAIDPTFLITHRRKDVADGPELYKTFRDKQDGCVKVVFDLTLFIGKADRPRLAKVPSSPLAAQSIFQHRG